MLEHFKRIPATDRFSVIRANDVDPASCFDIGRLLNRTVGRHIAPRSGELGRYAYDLPGMYGNNSGAIATGPHRPFAMGCLGVPGSLAHHAALKPA